MRTLTALSPDLFSDRAAEAGNMVTVRHQKLPQMRGIGSNEAASRTQTRLQYGSLFRSWLSVIGNATVFLEVVSEESAGRLLFYGRIGRQMRPDS